MEWNSIRFSLPGFPKFVNEASCWCECCLFAYKRWHSWKKDFYEIFLKKLEMITFSNPSQLTTFLFSEDDSLESFFLDIQPIRSTRSVLTQAQINLWNNRSKRKLLIWMLTRFSVSHQSSEKLQADGNTKHVSVIYFGIYFGFDFVKLFLFHIRVKYINFYWFLACQKIVTHENLFRSVITKKYNINFYRETRSLESFVVSRRWLIE